MLLYSLLLTLAAFAIGLTSAAPHAPAGLSSRHNALQKRASGQFTYYAVGMGACGKQNVDSDYVAALNTPSWDGGSHCFETVTITVNGITIQVQIVDRCESCGSSDLDLSSGAFHGLGGTDSQGVIFGTWNFGSGAVPTTTTTEKPTTSPTSISTLPSSTSTPPPSTTSSQPPGNTSSSLSPPSSSSSSNVAAPTPAGVLAQSLLFLGELGELVLVGASQ